MRLLNLAFPLFITLVMASTIVQAQTHLELTVTDTSGAAIPGAKIQIDADVPKVLPTTDSQGKIVLNPTPGKHTISVKSQWFVPWIRQVEVQNDAPQSIAIELQLRSGSSIEVIQSAEIPTQRFNSDQQIPYVLPNHPFVLRASFKPAAHMDAAFPAQSPKTRIELTVTDTSGAVIPGAQIQIDPNPCTDQPLQTTDNHGKIVLSVTPGEHKISIKFPGFKPWSQEVDAQGDVPQSIYAKLQVAGGSSVEVQLVPDLILYNGVILTGECVAEGNPKIVQAIAISGNQIIAVGSNEDVRRTASPTSELRDLHGGFLMPGLNDAHVHLGGAGQTKLNVDLTGTKSLAEMLDRIKAKADLSPRGHWLTGGGWDHTLWADKTLPTRQDLDKVTGDHPTLLERIDGHIAVANTAALNAAKITGQSKAPQGGSIDLDAKGQPTGILRDTAMEEFEKLIPPPTHDERREGLSLAIADALAHGLTSVQDNSEWDDFLTMEELEKDGKLNLRISEWLPFAAPLDELKAHRAYHDVNDPMLHTGMLKGFMDGSLGSRTAALKAPYADDATNSGLARYDQAKLNAMAVERAQAGFQIGFHAIGDLATAMALNAFSQPVGDGKLVATGHRDRIEHAQVVDPADITRFAKLGVIASMQPNHLLTDMNWAEDRLGPQRAAYSYAWKAYLDQGVVLAFGTDYPVEPVTPFRGIYAAVTRMNEAGNKSYFPENKLTIAQALYAYTQGSAYAEFEEQHKGKLAPGFDADFIILDRNLLTIEPAEILKTKVLETVVAGKTAYKARP